jgi:hypothetical protein
MPKCKICKTSFKPFSSLEQWCSPHCGYLLSKKRVEAKNKSEAKIERKELKKRKDKLKNKSDWLKDAQNNACNPYIRLRDEGELCISCQKPPKKKNAGHYLSVGAHPELRFHPMNIHLQCEHCNTYKSGNQANYRINLINKIGIDIVEFLEGPHEIQHLSIDDIQEIKSYYKEQTKILKSTN